MIEATTYDSAVEHEQIAGVLGRADVEALPFEQRSFDLCITYTGLHCLADPPAAIAEMARALRPGGELRGPSVIKRTGLRQDTFVRLMQLGGVFGPGQTLAELETFPRRRRPREGQYLLQRRARLLLRPSTRCSQSRGPSL